MNEADKAIEEIREVRHRISAEFDHDITKYIAALREEEMKHPEQIQRGKELVAQPKTAQKKYPEKMDEVLVLRDKPIP